MELEQATSRMFSEHGNFMIRWGDEETVFFPKETKHYKIEKNKNSWDFIPQRSSQATDKDTEEVAESADLLKQVESCFAEESLLGERHGGFTCNKDELFPFKTVDGSFAETSTGCPVYRVRKGAVVVFEGVSVSEEVFLGIVKIHGWKQHGMFSIKEKEDASLSQYKFEDKKGRRCFTFHNPKASLLKETIEKEREEAFKEIFVFSEKEDSIAGWFEKEAGCEIVLGKVLRLQLYGYGLYILKSLKIAEDNTMDFLCLSAFSKEEVGSGSVADNSVELGRIREVYLVDYGVCAMKKIKLPEKNLLEKVVVFLTAESNMDGILEHAGSGRVDLGKVVSDGNVDCRWKNIKDLLAYTVKEERGSSFWARKKHVESAPSAKYSHLRKDNGFMFSFPPWP
ncbi:MAG: uncharacterized protein A8A55_2313 [Amphiamblys sp. WSBS2006]|nr:MAG: uncharacterized protein A8A55_2313 [Amphiamblys sp. WSBS2006]